MPPELAAVRLLVVPATIHMGFTTVLVLSSIAVGAMFGENQLCVPTREEFTEYRPFPYATHE